MNRDDIIRTIDWILDLCPEIDKWQADIIAEYASNLVKNEREECAKLATSKASVDDASNYPTYIAAAIRARSKR